MPHTRDLAKRRNRLAVKIARLQRLLRQVDLALAQRKRRELANLERRAELYQTYLSHQPNGVHP